MPLIMALLTTAMCGPLLRWWLPKICGGWCRIEASSSRPGFLFPVRAACCILDLWTCRKSAHPGLVGFTKLGFAVSDFGRPR
jgi:hypothetical protein